MTGWPGEGGATRPVGRDSAHIMRTWWSGSAGGEQEQFLRCRMARRVMRFGPLDGSFSRLENVSAIINSNPIADPNT
ncbi:unnamed protein product [Heligmosomoides polygyrus]|uniref:Uncharacterized protein n=1 Tax=Heligmosomoides polygyrus TaxID=6339 RepID=A0A183FRE7_HELPZ|nr:unnamed protein product [Heligmosomoides polygyrus]